MVLGGQKPADRILRVVGVLVLIDHDVAESILIGGEYVLVVLQQQVGVEQQIVEIERVGGLEALLQALVDARGDLAHRIARLLGEIPRDDQLVFGRGDAVHERVDREALGVDVQLGHDLLVQALLVVGVVDGEVAGEAHALSVGAQDAHAHAVERRHPHAARTRTHQPAEALAHLGRRLVSERDRQNLPRRHVQIVDEMRDAVGQNARLARSGTRQHQQGAFGALDRLALRSVEGVQIDGHGNASFPHQANERGPPASRRAPCEKRSNSKLRACIVALGRHPNSPSDLTAKTLHDSLAKH